MRFGRGIPPGCTCDPGCYPEGGRRLCPIHGDEHATAVALLLVKDQNEHDNISETYTVDLETFCRVNLDAPDICRRARALRLGCAITVGGGAAPLFRITRVR